MKTYYLEKDNKIVLHDTDRNRLFTTLKFTPQYNGLEIKETDRPIEDFEWADTEEYAIKKHKKEIVCQLEKLESDTGLKRAIRELVLSGSSGSSEYAKAKAQEMENLAQELRN